MERAEKQRLILAASNYNSRARNMASCNALYMGSMATAILMSKLGGEYGRDGLATLVKCATDEQLDAGLAVCQNIIDYAKLGDKAA